MGFRRKRNGQACTRALGFGNDFVAEGFGLRWRKRGLLDGGEEGVGILDARGGDGEEKRRGWRIHLN